MMLLKVFAALVLVCLAAVVIGWIWVRRLAIAATNQAAASPPREASGYTLWSVTILMELEWHRFEQVVAAYEEELGHTVRLKGFGLPGGFMARVAPDENDTPVRLLQCRVFDDKKVDVPLIRELHDAMRAEKMTQGTFYTTTDFTASARSFASGNKIDLVSGRELLNRFSALSPEAQTRLFELALSPHHRIPTCPNCGVKMTLREPAQRPKFWACLNTPNCNVTLEPRRR
jgi:restriction system protein